MRRYLGTFLLGAFLATPVLMLADDHDQKTNRVERYYDPDTKQYHEWNESEEHAYHSWWDENHKGQQYREFKKLKNKDRAEYWRWRHEHQDTH